MGYEVRLIIGHTGFSSSPEHERSEVAELDNDGKTYWYPYKKDAFGKYIETGRQEHIFLTVAEVDLCKIGYNGYLSTLISDNERSSKADTKNVYKWYDGDGNTTKETDSYGAKKNPVSIPEIIKAIKKDNKENYRRFDWALALLNSIHKTSPNEFQVILYGY